MATLLKKYIKLENGVPDACTLDAMGTQTEIAKKITEKGADYILALKENQKTFYEDVRLFFKEYRTDPADLDPACCTGHSASTGVRSMAQPSRTFTFSVSPAMPKSAAA